MATKELSINQILCASLEELKNYANTKGITLPSGATKPIIQDLLITACSKSDETQILQAKMQLLAAEQDALARKLASENQARIDEAVALDRKLAAEQQARDAEQQAIERKFAAEQQATERKIAADLQLSRTCREETERRLAMEAEAREAEVEAHAATERARQRAHESEMKRRRERQEQEIEAARLLREVGDQGHGQGHGQVNLFKPASVVKMLSKWHKDNIDIFFEAFERLAVANN